MLEDRSSTASKILLVICSTLLVLLSSELLLRTFSVDLRLMRKTLYYQCSSLPLHKSSSDAQRIYELRPNTSLKGVPHPHSKETKYKTLDISINALGFRGKPFEPAKKPGVFRIVIFGGSNTFGSSVSDEDTYPAQMQRIFDEKYPGKVEVWNAGTCAYEMSQDVAYAETVMKKYDPDIVILQDTNRDRRAFHYNVTFKELKGLFGKNKELYVENIPPLWQLGVRPKERMRFFLVSLGCKIHHSLVPVSSLYRTLCLSLYSWQGVFAHNTPTVPVAKTFACLWSYDGQIISNRDLNSFTERHKDKKILLFFISELAYKVGHDGVITRENMGDFVLDAKGKPPEYREIHPPSYVYAWYARELCDFLVNKGYIPASSPEATVL